MLITRISNFTNTEHSMEIDVTERQLIELATGAPIQTIMPNLTEWERQFILTGVTKAEWRELHDYINGNNDEHTD